MIAKTEVLCAASSAAECPTLYSQNEYLAEVTRVAPKLESSIPVPGGQVSFYRPFSASRYVRIAMAAAPACSSSSIDRFDSIASGVVEVEVVG